MAPKSKSPEKAKPAEDRQQRLKAALKANMAKRKAQARARATDTAATGHGTTGTDNREG